MRRATNASASRLASSAQCTSSTTSTVATAVDRPGGATVGELVEQRGEDRLRRPLGQRAGQRRSRRAAHVVHRTERARGRQVVAGAFQDADTRVESGPERPHHRRLTHPGSAADQRDPTTAGDCRGQRGTQVSQGRLRSSSRIPARYGRGDPRRNRRPHRAASPTERTVGVQVPERPVPVGDRRLLPAPAVAGQPGSEPAEPGPPVATRPHRSRQRQPRPATTAPALPTSPSIDPRPDSRGQARRAVWIPGQARGRRQPAVPTADGDGRASLRT